MTLAGFAAVFLLGRAGEPVRPLLLSRKERLPIADLFGIYALERLFDLASAAIIAAIALLLFQSYGHVRSEEHTSELQSHLNLVCLLLLEKKKKQLRRLLYDLYT